MNTRARDLMRKMQIAYKSGDTAEVVVTPAFVVLLCWVCLDGIRSFLLCISIVFTADFK